MCLLILNPLALRFPTHSRNVAPQKSTTSITQTPICVLIGSIFVRSLTKQYLSIRPANKAGQLTYLFQLCKCEVVCERHGTLRIMDWVPGIPMYLSQARSLHLLVRYLHNQNDQGSKQSCSLFH